MIMDPSFSYDGIQSQIPAVQYIDYFEGLFPFNDSFVEKIHKAADSCGYTEYLNKYMTFPPPGPQPARMPGTLPNDGLTARPECDVFWGTILSEIFQTNPCFNVYHVSALSIIALRVLTKAGQRNMSRTVGRPGLPIFR